MYRSLPAAFAALLLCVSPAAAETKGEAVGMVTGPKTGTYIALGKDIASVAKTEGIALQVKESGGSIDNIRRMNSEENASLGIVQSDVLGFLKRSTNAKSKHMADGLRMIFPFNKEEVHIIARSDIKDFAGLAGKRVIVGAEGSGSMVTAVNLFTLTGVTPAQLLKIDPPQGMVAVLNNDADAMVFVGGKPVRLFKNLEEIGDRKNGANPELLGSVHFLALNDPKMLAEYAPSSLTPADYTFVKEDVPTIAVTSVLMTYDFSAPLNAYHKMRCAQLGKLGNALRTHLDYLKANGHPKWKEVDLDATAGLWKQDICSWAKSAKPAPTKANAPVNPLEKDLLGVIQSGNK